MQEKVSRALTSAVGFGSERFLFPGNLQPKRILRTSGILALRHVMEEMEVSGAVDVSLEIGGLHDDCDRPLFFQGNGLRFGQWGGGPSWQQKVAKATLAGF